MVTATALAGCLLTPSAAQATGSGPAPAPLHPAALGEPIPGRYIVVLDQGATGGTGAAVTRAERHGADVTREYAASIDGFAARMDGQQLAAVRADPAVAYVEPDQRVRIERTQEFPGWDLDRLDQRSLPLNRAYTYTETGAGVTAYVIDTGIRSGHEQFGGRVAPGVDEVGGSPPGGDCNGHGTHVAGSIGAADYGVAKEVALVGVRVLDCDGAGWLSAVIDGVDWVTAHHRSPAVANLSLGGPRDTALDSAVAESIGSGVTYTVAAGNESESACAGSPARVAAAITVAASTVRDQQAAFSNDGSCVDVYAPGTGIRSTWNTSDTATATLDGTSMAAPHVAGAAALYLQANPGATPGEVSAAIIAAATPHVLSGLGAGSPDLLLHVGGVGGDRSPAPVRPACSAATARHTGSLTRARRTAVEPGSGSYLARRAGWQLGCLERAGPDEFRCRAVPEGGRLLGPGGVRQPRRLHRDRGVPRPCRPVHLAGGGPVRHRPVRAAHPAPVTRRRARPRPGRALRLSVPGYVVTVNGAETPPRLDTATTRTGFGTPVRTRMS